MLEVLRYLRDNAYKTYIVTGGGQDFVRVYSRGGLRHPAGAGGRHRRAVTKYEYAKDGKPILIKEPKLLLNDNNAGKAEGIHLMIGKRPYAAFGNSTGDREMLEYTGAGAGMRLMMLCFITVPSANMPTARRASPDTRVAPLPRRSMTRRRRRAGP